MKTYLIILIASCFTFAQAQDHQRSIEVNGTAEIALPADQINITVQIRTVDASVERSKKANEKQLKELLDIIEDAGIDPKEIRITPILIGKNYEYIDRERRHRGFFTELSVSFLIKDLSKYYELINDISKNNVYEVNRSEYLISDYEIQHRAAYEKALKAAKEKAEYMCKALGVSLGEVLEIQENSSWQTHTAASNTISIADAASVSGKVVIKRSVSVKFGIK